MPGLQGRSILLATTDERHTHTYGIRSMWRRQPRKRGGDLREDRSLRERRLDSRVRASVLRNADWEAAESLSSEVVSWTERLRRWS